MRTIKFRGKRVDNGEWVYGDLIHGQGSKYERMYILPQTAIYPKGCNDLNGWNVSPNSVGQFTGLLDKNGEDIYEGDLLGRVVEGVKYCTSEIAHTNCGLFAKSLVAGVDFFFEITTVLDKYEIVGNIYDNPELLKTK